MTTLYLTEQQILVKKESETLVVHLPADEAKGLPKRKTRIPLCKVDRVVVQGRVTLTSPAVLALLEQRADICYLDWGGNYQGHLTPPFSKNSLLRLAQYRAHDNPAQALRFSQAFVHGKLANMRTMLLRANRKRNSTEIAAAAASIQKTLKLVDSIEAGGQPPPDRSRPQVNTPYGRLLGLEGAATSRYFGVFNQLLLMDWGFMGRRRRPPTDPVNALLSYGYTILMSKVASAASLVGLDPHIGYLHSSQYGKPALPLDLMEEFRPLIADSVVLGLLNNGMLKPNDFEEEFCAYRLTKHGRKVFLTRLEERLRTPITHPLFKYKATYSHCLELQVRILAKALMGEIPAYRPLTVR